MLVKHLVTVIHGGVRVRDEDGVRDIETSGIKGIITSQIGTGEHFARTVPISETPARAPFLLSVPARLVWALEALPFCCEAWLLAPSSLS